MTRPGDLVTLKRVVNHRTAIRSAAAPGNHLATVLVFPVPRSDAGLVQGLRAGRRDAVQALCDRYAAELLRVAMRVLGPEAAVADVVSEALRRAIDELARLENPRDLRYWLIWQLVEVMRRRLRATRPFRIWAALIAIVWPFGADRGCCERQRRTYRLLDRLPTDERIVLCLTRLDAMEPSAVATALGTSVARVRCLLERSETAFQRLSAR